MTFQQEKRAKIFHSASKKAKNSAFSHHFVALLRFSTFCPQKIHKKSTAKRRESWRKKSSVARVFSLSTKRTAPTTHTTKSFFHIHSFILFSRVKNSFSFHRPRTTRSCVHFLARAKKRTKKARLGGTPPNYPARQSRAPFAPSVESCAFQGGAEKYSSIYTACAALKKPHTLWVVLTPWCLSVFDAKTRNFAAQNL